MLYLQCRSNTLKLVLRSNPTINWKFLYLEVSFTFQFPQKLEKFHKYFVKFKLHFYLQPNHTGSKTCFFSSYLALNTNLALNFNLITTKNGCSVILKLLYYLIFLSINIKPLKLHYSI